MRQAALTDACTGTMTTQRGHLLQAGVRGRGGVKAVSLHGGVTGPLNSPETRGTRCVRAIRKNHLLGDAKVSPMTETTS